MGAVEVAAGNRSAAVSSLRGAVQSWTSLAAPYDAARTRLLLALAYEADGAPERAILELHAARSAFERLGAALDLRRTEARLAALQGSAAPKRSDDAERVVRTFVFTDVVDSTRLAGLLGDDQWGKVMRWHDGAIRAIVDEHGGEVIKATGDGFFLAFADADAAIDAMLGVQRRLAAQRDAQGFAPSVRIGLHTAEASQAGLDYLGMGVNYAARIGAAASEHEVLASAETLAAARRSFPDQHHRSLTLKGIPAPVEVASIAWR
jgi:class 3 adenylate cyclase